MSAAAIKAFHNAWGSSDYPPDPVDPDALASAEAKLGTGLPQPYKLAVLQTGLPRPTIELLDFICDHEIDFADISDFYAPDEIADETDEWRKLGMPNHLIVFASDCCGNKFSFSTQPQENADEVWYWDHDFDSVKRLAATFEAWLNCFVALKE
ncbi:MAG: SMI1/KNR4 family protein [Erythrobacter sp.]